jgi:hypothetical protein
MPEPSPLGSLCLFCGSSNAADPDYIEAAAQFGRILAAEDVRLVYGGGGIGLMGAAAKACHEAGGRVLGIMPDFLRKREVLYDEVETVVVRNMHQRKTMMYDASDAYVVMPGGIGTLEEIVEVLSWRRLELHIKPIVFLNLKNFWAPFYDLIAHTVAEQVTPAWVPTVWRSVDRVEDVLPALKRVEIDLETVKASA